MDTPRTSLGTTIARLRAQKGLSLKGLGKLVTKEDGTGGISAQYLHDIERDRRTPSPHVLAGLASALGTSTAKLSAIAGQPPASMVDYLRANPDQAADIAALFERLSQSGQQVDWNAVGANGVTHNRAVRGGA